MGKALPKVTKHARGLIVKCEHCKKNIFIPISFLSNGNRKIKSAQLDRGAADSLWTKCPNKKCDGTLDLDNISPDYYLTKKLG